MGLTCVYLRILVRIQNLLKVLGFKASEIGFVLAVFEDQKLLDARV